METGNKENYGQDGRNFHLNEISESDVLDMENENFKNADQNRNMRETAPVSNLENPDTNSEKQLNDFDREKKFDDDYNQNDNLEDEDDYDENDLEEDEDDLDEDDLDEDNSEQQESDRQGFENDPAINPRKF